MAIKARITKEEFSKLSADMQAEYKASGDEYVIEVEGLEDAGELRRALLREREEAREVKARAKELEEQLRDKKDDKARKNNDIDSLEKSYQQQLKELKDASESRITGYRDRIVRGELDRTVGTLAGELFTSARLGAPHVKDRLRVELDDNDAPQIRVLDKAGNVTAHTLDDLRKEFVADKDFSSILKGSNASGGAPRDNTSPPGGASRPAAQESTKRFADMTPKELAKSMASRIPANSSKDI